MESEVGIITGKKRCKEKYIDMETEMAVKISSIFRSMGYSYSHCLYLICIKIKNYLHYSRYRYTNETRYLRFNVRFLASAVNEIVRDSTSRTDIFHRKIYKRGTS